MGGNFSLGTGIHCNKPNHLISSREFKIIENRAKSEEFSCSKFLSETESLITVIEKDEQYLAEKGITHKQIADFLNLICDKSMRIRELAAEEKFKIDVGSIQESETIHCKNVSDDMCQITINGMELKIKYEVWKGAQECPFQNKSLDKEYHGYSYGSVDCKVIGKDFVFSFNTLLPHMIEAHHFFEGSVTHRVCPAEVIQYFNLQPNVSYEPVLDDYFNWTFKNNWTICYNDEYAKNKETILKSLKEYMYQHIEFEIKDVGSTDVFLIAERDIHTSYKCITEAFNAGIRYNEYRRRVYTKEYVEPEKQYILKNICNHENCKLNYTATKCSELVARDERLKNKLLHCNDLKQLDEDTSDIYMLVIINPFDNDHYKNPTSNKRNKIVINKLNELKPFGSEIDIGHFCSLQFIFDQTVCNIFKRESSKKLRI